MIQRRHPRICADHLVSLLAAICLLAACGGALSTKERRNHDDQSSAVGDLGEELAVGEYDNATNEETTEDPRITVGSCIAPELRGYRYAVGEAFWLGEQTANAYEVHGFGYFGAQPGGSPVGHYRRSVELSVGPTGVLEDQTGAQLIGFPMTDSGESHTPCTLRAPITSSPTSTTRVQVIANLDAETVIGLDPFDPAQPAAEHMTSILLVDDRGKTFPLDIYFVKTDFNVIEYHVLISDEVLSGVTPGYPVELGVGTLTFSTNGALLDARDATVVIEFANGAGLQFVEFDFGDDIINDGTAGLNGTTSFAEPTAVYSVVHDGFTAGTGLAAHVDAYGRVTVEFDSGSSVNIGNIALARFRNEDKLEEVTNGSLRSTTGSGDAQYELPGSPGRGLLD